MANASTITLGQVSYVDGLYNISVHVVLTYDAHDPLEFDVSSLYNASAPDWAAWRTEILNKIKSRHTIYMNERAKAALSALATTITAIKTAIDTYIS